MDSISHNSETVLKEKKKARENVLAGCVLFG